MAKVLMAVMVAAALVVAAIPSAEARMVTCTTYCYGNYCTTTCF